ncbi:MAG TPA: MoaD/ThiS family protein [Candidatus Obscuribacterales bacterium]
MIVHIPSPLRSYTGRQSRIEAEGASVAELLADMDRRYPGIKFRMIDEQESIRQHIRIFVNTEQAEQLSHRLNPGDTVHIICALSGG